MVGDFVTQTDWMATNKLKSAFVRGVHVSVYSLGFILVVLAARLDALSALLFVALLWITHFITDSRRWASGDKWPPKPIMVDQSLHIATLAWLAWLFNLH